MEKRYYIKDKNEKSMKKKISKPSQEMKGKVILRIIEQFGWSGNHMLFPYQEQYKEVKNAVINLEDLIKIIKWEK